MGIYDQPLSDEHREYLKNMHPRGQQIIDEVDKMYGTEIEDVPPYEAWGVEELKVELEARSLNKSGKKDELVARLYENDGQLEE